MDPTGMTPWAHRASPASSATVLLGWTGTAAQTPVWLSLHDGALPHAGSLSLGTSDFTLRNGISTAGDFYDVAGARLLGLGKTATYTCGVHALDLAGGSYEDIAQGQRWGTIPVGGVDALRLVLLLPNGLVYVLEAKISPPSSCFSFSLWVMIDTAGQLYSRLGAPRLNDLLLWGPMQVLPWFDRNPRAPIVWFTPVLAPWLQCAYTFHVSFSGEEEPLSASKWMLDDEVYVSNKGAPAEHLASKYFPGQLFPFPLHKANGFVHFCTFPKFLGFWVKLHLSVDELLFNDVASTLVRLRPVSHCGLPGVAVERPQASNGIPTWPRSVNVDLRATIDRSELVASIAGGSFRTAQWAQPLQLDGSASHDPDEASPHHQLSFAWLCSCKISELNAMAAAAIDASAGVASNPCRVASSPAPLPWVYSTSPTLDIAARLLMADAVYHFLLVVRKEGRAEVASARQAVRLTSASTVPVVELVCILNCGPAVNPSERLVLSGRCNDCNETPERRLGYEWSLMWVAASASGDDTTATATEVLFDWDKHSLTGCHRSFLSLNPHAFADYVSLPGQLLLQLNTTSADAGRSSIHRWAFVVNPIPSGGSCKVRPTEGTALVTWFQVACKDFQNHHQPLRYKVFSCMGIPLTSVCDGTIIYSGYNPWSPQFLLPGGTQVLCIEVWNAVDAYTTLFLNVSVSKQPDTSITILDLQSMVLGNDSKLVMMLKGGDTSAAAYLIYLVASELNNVASNMDDAQQTALHARLLGGLENVPLNNRDDILLVSAALQKATMGIGNLAAGQSLELLTKTVTRLSKVNNAIHSLLSGFNELEAIGIERVGTAVLGALTSVLDASSSTSEAAPQNQSAMLMNVGVPAIAMMAELGATVLVRKVNGEASTVLEAHGLRLSVRKAEMWDMESGDQANVDCTACLMHSPVSNTTTPWLGPNAVVSTMLLEFETSPLPSFGPDTNFGSSVIAFAVTAVDTDLKTVELHTKSVDLVVRRRQVGDKALPVHFYPDENARTGSSAEFVFNVNMMSVGRGTLTFLKFSIRDSGLSISLMVNINAVASRDVHAILDDIPFPKCQGSAMAAECSRDSLLPSKPWLLSHRTANPHLIKLPTWILQNASGSDSMGKAVATSYRIFVRLEPTQQVENPGNLGVNVTLFQASCLDYQSDARVWDELACKLGPLTTGDKLHCQCGPSHGGFARIALGLMLRTMATRLFIIPEVIDLRKILVLIRSVAHNFIIVLTMSAVLVFFGFTFCWVRRKQRCEDQRHLADSSGIRSIFVNLDDKEESDSFFYILTVFTGSRPTSGTTSDVYLMLVGSNGCSKTHHVSAHGRSLMKTASVDVLLFTAKQDLGELCYLRAWVIHQGNSPSWYLSRVKVEYPLSGRCWFFLCRRWLSGSDLDHIFPVSDLGDSASFWTVLSIQFAVKMCEDHLWLSVFHPTPIGKSFTRTKRLGCCVCLQLFDMLTSIMLFRLSQQALQNAHSLVFRLLQSLTIVVESALIGIPLQLIVVKAFHNGDVEAAAAATACSCTTFCLPLQPQHSIRLIRQQPELSSSSRAQKWKERLRHGCFSESKQNYYIAPQTSSGILSHHLRNARGTSQLSLPNGPRLKGCVLPEAYFDKILGGIEVFEESTIPRGINFHVHQTSTTDATLNVVDTSSHAASNNAAIIVNSNVDQFEVDKEADNNNDNASDEKADDDIEYDNYSTKEVEFYRPLSPKCRAVLSCLRAFLGWVVVSTVSFISIFFIILYGFQYGQVISLRWLFATIYSILQSVALVQPARVLLFTAIHAYRRRTCGDLNWGPTTTTSDCKIAQRIFDNGQ
ncbi:polycystin family receptor for egg jelly-like isoform X2 [Lethenteron reissneri]|uniref:polycystin family receptor for egg jelly-like isoform X2 n=1 Tax=Lethenteron reissneri TaxID=7753 RepID=UPI002AB7A4B2|nr:polycystin family receptor for egg jelly-like isoform X2 [Lethenteron reissneri]